jgi:hypothetical protein
LSNIRQLQGETTMRNHFFISSFDGHLYDTRRADCWDHPLRTDYARVVREFSTVPHMASRQLRAAVRQAYAWPGGYEIAFVCVDGEYLCRACVLANWRLVSNSVRSQDRSGWRVIGIETADNFENHETCAHCAKGF